MFNDFMVWWLMIINDSEQSNVFEIFKIFKIGSTDSIT
jgi:hypothetical protein